MYNDHKKYALFVGRWQPFHSGHKYIIDQAIEKGENVCIAIRNTEISDDNPFTVEQRAEMIKRVYGDKVDIMVIPDIKSINIGRNVGYDINITDVPQHIKKISGTNVREGRECNVPSEVSEYIKTLTTTLWFTGLPCSGKTTLAKRVKEELENMGYNVVHLDGDNIRSGINSDLGFSTQDRKENLRRVAHIAKLFNENKNFVIASFITPTNESRETVKEIVGNLKLVYVKCSAETCEKRDSKEMYKKARKGEIKDFTGISAPFEEPKKADIIVDTESQDIETCTKKILDTLNVDRLTKNKEYIKKW